MKVTTNTGKQTLNKLSYKMVDESVAKEIKQKAVPQDTMYCTRADEGGAQIMFNDAKVKHVPGKWK